MRHRVVALKARATAKTSIRRIIRSFGYDLVPFTNGFITLQTRLLAKLPIVLDVGANVGQYGERLRDYGFEGRIISFEPGKDSFEILKGKAARNSNWDVRNVALGSVSGRADLLVSANSVSSSLLDVQREHLDAAPGARTVSRETVAVDTLDAQTAQVEGPFWLKLDVQGFERQVLDGGARTLERTHAIQIEVSFAEMYEQQADWVDLANTLIRKGFVCRHMELGTEDPRSGHLLQADLLFVRRPPIKRPT